MEGELEREASEARELRARIALLGARSVSTRTGSLGTGTDRSAEVLQRARGALAAARARRGAAGQRAAPTVTKAVACLAQRDLFAPCYEDLAKFLRAVPGTSEAADVVEALLGQYSRLTQQWRALVEEQERRLTEEAAQARDAAERAEGAAETLLRVAERLEQENAELSSRRHRGDEEEVEEGRRGLSRPTPSPSPLQAPVSTASGRGGGSTRPFFFGEVAGGAGSPVGILESQKGSSPLTLQQWREVLGDLQRFITRPEKRATAGTTPPTAGGSARKNKSAGKGAPKTPPSRPRGTDKGLEKWVEAYLRVRFGPDKNKVQEWKQLLLGAAQAFATTDAEAAVFLKSWDGALECTFYTKLRKAGRAFDRLVQQYRAVSRGNPGESDARTPERLEKDEYEHILGHLARSADRELVVHLCSITASTMSVDARLFKHAFLSVMVEGHERNLRPVERAWKFSDVKGVGSLGHSGFAKFCRALKADMSRGEVAALVQMLDPSGSGRISYERCLHNFSAELWSLDGRGGFLRGDAAHTPRPA